jgi:methyl-galactoside transport system ATP-binding protein
MDLALQGKSIIMISSEMVELIGVCDRVMVMCDGRKAGELQKDELSEQNIMRLAVQFM